MFKNINFLWVSLGQIIGVIGTIVLIKLLTNVLSVADYGNFALWLSFVGIATNVVFGGISPGVNRYYSIEYKGKKIASYIGAVNELSKYGVAILLLLLLFSSVLISQLNLIVKQETLFWLGLYSIGMALYGMLNGLLNTADLRREFAACKIMEPWLKALILIYYISGEIHLNITNILIIYSVATIVVIVFQIYTVYIKLDTNGRVENSEKIRIKKEIVYYSKVFLVTSLLFWVLRASDRWILEIFSETEHVAYYALLYQIGFAPTILIGSIVLNYLMPIIFTNSRGEKDNYIENIKLLFNYCAVVIVSIMLALDIMGESIVLLVSNDSFIGISSYIKWFFLAGSLYVFSQLLELELMSKLERHKVFYTRSITALIGITLNIFLGWSMGLKGVILALVITSFFYLAIVSRAIHSLNQEH